ncbi:hypothetical protein HO133_001156 [Letharia lupina]|uniref:Uncharacterized protein n=1 Tax=Letharia lupina TaxID=560253 RepID=A0A8H6CEU5_9LECA|nr:uncharacterized protein HO133_001156 [Letharia lupina]KAF6222070.1 hypothetical protein HO133_001156 [Letharia lupina]
MVCYPGKDPPLLAIVAQRFGGIVHENESSGEKPSSLRTLPSLRRGREAEERARRSSGAQYTTQVPLIQSVPKTWPQGSIPPIPASTSMNVNTFSRPPVQPLIRSEQGKTVSWSTKAPFTMSIDSGRKQIRFSHCPALTFPSMQYAYDYFHVQEKLHNQCAIQNGRPQRLQAAQRPLRAEQQGYLAEHLGLRAGQLANFAAQQACLAESLCPFEPVWQFDTPLKPIDAQDVLNLPTPPSHSVFDSQHQLATEPFAQSLWKESVPVHSSSGSPPPESPPQTLFAESTPHAREIQARPRLRLPVKGLQSWPFRSQVTNDNPFLQSSSIQPADQAMTLPGSYHQPSTCIGTVLPRTLTNEVDISDQPPTFHGLYHSPFSYADTVLPQTLNRKDRRVLGVSSSAGVDE